MWIESHQSLLTHRKTGRLARALGVSKITAIGHLHAMWWWCLDNAKTGDLTNVDAEDIADGACWEEDARKFVDGLIFAGFLDADMQVHDWMDYAGRLIEKREADAERKRAARHPNTVQRTSNGHPEDGAGTVPNLTVPNHTHSTNGATEPIEATPEPPANATVSATVDNFTPAFEAAWSVYPSRRGKKLNKAKAQTAFRQIKPRDWDNVLVAITNLANSTQGKKGIVEDMHRFLPHWQDWLEPEKPVAVDLPKTTPTLEETRHLLDTEYGVRRTTVYSRAGPKTAA